MKTLKIYNGDVTLSFDPKEHCYRWVEEQCGKGYRLSMMLMIERIIAENKLDRFPKLDAAE